VNVAIGLPFNLNFVSTDVPVKAQRSLFLDTPACAKDYSILSLVSAIVFWGIPGVVLTQKSVEGKLEGVDLTQEGKGSCKRNNEPLREN
jgi:hypothetical protein